MTLDAKTIIAMEYARDIEGEHEMGLLIIGEQFAKRHDGSRCLAELRPLMTFNCEGRLRRTLSGTKVLIGLPEIS